MLVDRRDRTGRAVLVVAVVAVAVAAWFGWTWWQASQEDGPRLAVARDDVLDTARRLLVDLNTVDYRDADAGLARWRQVSTGALLDELDRGSEVSRRDIKAQQTVATARILGAAVTGVDTAAGKASVIAAVEVRLSTQGSQPSVTHSRLDAVMVRTDHGWKVSALRVVGQGGGS